MDKVRIMNYAWNIARKGAATHGGKASDYIAESMKMAWARAKKEQQQQAPAPVEQAPIKLNKDAVKRAKRQLWSGMQKGMKVNTLPNTGTLEYRVALRAAQQYEAAQFFKKKQQQRAGY